MIGLVAILIYRNEESSSFFPLDVTANTVVAKMAARVYWIYTFCRAGRVIDGVCQSQMASCQTCKYSQWSHFHPVQCKCSHTPETHRIQFNLTVCAHFLILPACSAFLQIYRRCNKTLFFSDGLVTTKWAASCWERKAHRMMGVLFSCRETGRWKHEEDR